MRSARRDPLDRPQRGLHRSEPADKTRLAAVGYFLGSTVPRHVQPPRLLNVALISGVTLALTLFGYSTTQIYLRFSEPPAAQQAGPTSPDTSERLDPSAEPGTRESEEDAAEMVSVVSYEAVEASGTGFTGEVTVTNTGSAALEDWELALEFAEARVTSVADAEWRATENGVVASEPAGAGGLAPGDSVTLNFRAEGRAQNPVSCSLNGNPCDWAGADSAARS
ncbi:cellulose binding domain-containing protein [Streptomonospora salina]|uniref:CBM2 domain-containing protein n=1 Tax=Streptomonospora salina TaxID=104205 RepID=A0A841E9D5_9ACTN|nr:cellulose binding domain-containing protein [Streptomonospora salina]MBB5999616.1 hypothetical protein [Streptomonospora salina]